MSATPAGAREVLQKGEVALVPLNGEISSSLAAFVRRTEKQAETAGASAIIFEMDTYGGRLDAAEEITDVLNHATIPTYTFINTNAGSAGALIALATRNIYMAPVSAIGAAAPVLVTGEDLPETEREKTISYWSALIRSTAVRNGHNPDIGEAFMNKEKEVKIGDRVVHAKGSLLTLSAQEAAEQINGKPLLAAGRGRFGRRPVRKAGLEGHVVALAPTGFERLAFWITALAPLALVRRNRRRLSRVQNSRREHSRNHLGDLFHALFSGSLSRRPGRLGSRRPLCCRLRSRAHRDPLLRSLHHHRRRRWRLPHAWLPCSGR